MRGQPFYRTMRNEAAKDVWSRWEFPTFDPYMIGDGDRWFAAKCTLQKPYCFTPTKAFYFGGKRYVGLYPCIAFATRNFGFIVQRGPQGIVFGRE